MSGDDWSTAQRLLRGWPEVPIDLPVTGTCRRLRDALLGLPKGDAGWRDVTSLVRQILLEGAARQGAPVPLGVPLAHGLPTREQWQQAHCSAIADGKGLSITANPWHPPIGPTEDSGAPDADLLQIYRRRSNRRPDEIPADPFWIAALDHRSYMSIGQRQAARTVAIAPPGSTTILCLPTGRGKTEVALAPTLLAAGEPGVCLIVVPTVVLALDMERRIRQLLAARGEASKPARRYAYTSGLSNEEKLAIRNDVRDGRQRVLVTSPEAVVTGLSASLGAAAEAGHLRHLVIDEAHLVEQWGTEFRPEFQTMASQRLAWLSKAPPRRAVTTIAMSATLTQRQVRTLTELFGADDLALVWASGLRQEPTYYIQRCDDEPSRREAVLAAVELLPRPLVLYAALKSDVVKWAADLREAGFGRVAHVTGDSTEEQRRHVLDGWRESSGDKACPTQFDIVVGTSAFGLGINMPDVRTVVHTCLPETIDRYYQEVGRGGRDGHPCIAYLATAPSDTGVARNLNKQVVIGDELGWGRWQSLFSGAEQIESRTYAVRLDALPAHLSSDSVKNQQWNVRTLNLMVQARLIRLSAAEPPSRTDEEDGASFAARLSAFYATASTRINVELLDEATNERRHWEQAVVAQRTVISGEQHTALQKMRDIVGGGQCVGDILASYYRMPWHGGLLTTGVNCRGCPHCRGSSSPHPDDPLALYRIAPEPFPAVTKWKSIPLDPFAGVRAGVSWLSIWYRNDQARLDLVPELLEKLARRGIPVFGGPGIDARTAAQLQAAVRPRPVIVDHDHDLLTSYSGPVVWLLDTSSVIDEQLADRLNSPDLTYLIHPDSLESPDRPGVRLIDVCHAPMSVATALGVL